MNNHTKDSRTLHRNNRLSHHHNPFDKDIFIITLYYVKANSNLNKDYKDIGTSTELSVGTYTFESDGYIVWNVYQSGHGFNAALNNNIGISQNYDGTQNAGAVFALKGMTLTVNTKTGGNLMFFPIIYKE